MTRAARTWAKSDAWVVAEWIGLLGLVLLSSGVIPALHVTRRSRRVHRLVVSAMALVIVGYAVAVWIAQKQAREQSAAPVGMFGSMLSLDITYSPLVIAALSLLGFMLMTGAVNDSRERWKTAEERGPRRSTVSWTG